MSNWINTHVKLSDSWGQGATHSLSTPTGHPAEFRLLPRYVRDAHGTHHLAHYSIDFPSGYLPDGWAGVNFIALGDKDVKGISKLPAWSPKHRDTYRKMIEDAGASLGHSHTRRLEAIIPYAGAQGVAYNIVRLFYVPQAVGGAVTDLVVLKIASHKLPGGTVEAKQDGSAHGPPN